MNASGPRRTRVVVATLVVVVCSEALRGQPCLPCTADITGNGLLQATDTAAVRACLLGSFPIGGLESCDANCDGVVDLMDVGTVDCAVTTGPSCCLPVSTGACCHNGQKACHLATAALCATEGGTYLGNGSTCDDNPCDCNRNGVTDGDDVHGVFLGAATDLVPNASIPDNTGALTDVLNVAANRPIGDVNVRVEVTHPNIQNLLITLTHDSTMVTLFNHACAGAANLSFTTFDDEAPVSIVCSVTNHIGTFRPVQPLSAFDGSMTLGNWTLTVQDTVTGQAGTLDEWAIFFREPPVSEDCNANDVPDECDISLPTPQMRDVVPDAAIPDNATPLVNMLTFPTAGEIVEVSVGLDITHTRIGDLDIQLTHNGTTITLYSGECTAEDNLINTRFDDQAAGDIDCSVTDHTGTFTPFQALAAYVGDEAMGDWTLTITDMSAGETGTLRAWDVVVLLHAADPFGSQDCNGNDVPDECDSATCGGNPDCDDCNLNQVLDACDIAGATSVDVNVDQVPDECTFWVGSVMCSQETWFCAENWSGGVVPDNGVDDYFVTIDLPTADVVLDADATIETLRLLNGATLNITGTSSGDLTVEGTGGAVIGGTVYVDHDRSLQVPNGTMTIAAGGEYAPAPAATAVTATLMTKNLEVEESPLAPGEITVNNAMMVMTANNLTTKGTNASPGGILTGCRPPILNLGGTATIEVGRNVALRGGVEMLPAPGAASAGGVNPRIRIAGDFFNHSRFPELVDWGELTFEMNGSAAEGSQIFEAPSEDLGNGAGGFSNNFAIDRVQIDTGSDVTLIDLFNNVGMAGVPESTYVTHLHLQNGATLNVNGVSSFYNFLTDDGATVNQNGGMLVLASEPTGACCEPPGSCSSATEANCKAGGNDYQGNAVSCASVTCPVRTGACCVGSSCSVTEDVDCGGSWQGPGTDCSPNPCSPPPTGACCTGGSCSVTTSAGCGGTWQGAGTDCSPNPCSPPPPTGACCSGQSCTVTTSAGCGALWFGAGTNCVFSPCLPPAGGAPTMPQWGLIVMGLAFMTAALLVLGRRDRRVVPGFTTEGAE